MMRRYRSMLFFVFIFLLFASLPLNAVLAQSSGDRVISDGEVVDGDVTVLEGDLTIEDGAVVTGSVVVMDGDLDLAGVVNGDVALFDGALNLGETAVLGGECIVLHGNMEIAEGQSVTCRSLSFPALERIFDSIPPVPEVPAVPETPAVPPVPPVVQGSHWGFGHFIGNVMETAGWTFTLGVLALIVASVFPRQLNQVGTVISEKPVASGTVGLLTGVAGASLLALMSAIFSILILACGLGLLGFPIVFVVSVALLAAAILGWIAIGQKVGVWLAGPLKLKNPSLPTTTVLGTIALSLLVGLMNILGLEFGQWLLSTIIGAVGLGAAALTQFGTRPYPAVVVNPDKVAAAVNNMPE